LFKTKLIPLFLLNIIVGCMWKGIENPSRRPL